MELSVCIGAEKMYANLDAVFFVSNPYLRSMNPRSTVLAVSTGITRSFVEFTLYVFVFVRTDGHVTPGVYCPVAGFSPYEILRTNAQ